MQSARKRKQPAAGKRIVIVANGPLPPERIVKKYAENIDLVICADGGANRIVGSVLEPDYLIGDLDSVTLETLNRLKEVKIIRQLDQESTDLCKALEFSERFGARKVFVFGATGERPDHFLGNISLIKTFKGRLEILFIDEWCVIQLIDRTLNIEGTPGQIVSLWPLSHNATGVSTSGLKYPLEDETLRQDTRGISNELAASQAAVKVRGGNLLAIIQHPELAGKQV